LSIGVNVVNYYNKEYGVAEYLAIYGDKLLSKESKVQNDADTKFKLEKLVTLFSYLTDKDLFIAVRPFFSLYL
jgi:hypothetical protein